MKKRIIFLVILLLITTGCTCQYDLTIENGVYKEKVTLTADNDEEAANFNNEWKIVTDKEEYEIGLGSDGGYEPKGDLYSYNLTGNNLTFTHDFTKNEYSNSTAAYNCYKLLTVSNYSESIIISTSQKALCFEKYPQLSSIVINVTVDKPATTNNADEVNGNTYTWKINKTNYNNKSINLILDNTEPETPVSSSSQKAYKKKSGSDYTLYIFAGILLVVMLTAYLLFNVMKNKNNGMDD